MATAAPEASPAEGSEEPKKKKPILLIIGIKYFIIKPRKSVSDAFLLGIVIYGVYAFTLAAILPEYTLSMGLTELIWGTLLYVLVTFLTKKLLNQI